MKCGRHRIGLHFIRACLQFCKSPGSSPPFFSRPHIKLFCRILLPYVMLHNFLPVSRRHPQSAASCKNIQRKRPFTGFLSTPLCPYVLIVIISLRKNQHPKMNPGLPFNFSHKTDDFPNGLCYTFSISIYARDTAAKLRT